MFGEGGEIGRGQQVRRGQSGPARSAGAAGTRWAPPGEMGGRAREDVGARSGAPSF